MPEVIFFLELTGFSEILQLFFFSSVGRGVGGLNLGGFILRGFKLLGPSGDPSNLQRVRGTGPKLPVFSLSPRER